MNWGHTYVQTIVHKPTHDPGKKFKMLPVHMFLSVFDWTGTTFNGIVALIRFVLN